MEQGCANILQHTCLSSNGQSGSSMWDNSLGIRAILTGKVRARTKIRRCRQSPEQSAGSCRVQECTRPGSLPDTPQVWLCMLSTSIVKSVVAPGFGGHTMGSKNFAS